jgi:acetyl-CoA synthetase
MTAPRRLDAYHFYERDWPDYDSLVDAFEWELPERFNVARYVCERWADDPDRVAVYEETRGGTPVEHTFADLDRRATALARYLNDRGVQRGDRVGIVSPQRPATLVAYIGAWKLGAVPVPLSTLFGPEALSYRLADSGATACVLTPEAVEPFRAGREDLPALETVLTGGGASEDAPGTSLQEAIDRTPAEFQTVETTPEDDGILIYTSGTTGDPKGVRHGHRVLLGHLPQFLTVFANVELTDGDVFWTPSEWSWVASLVQLVCPALFYGRPVVAHDGRFDPETVLSLIARHEVTSAFLPPTALRKLMRSDVDPDAYDLGSVRVVASAGEPTTESMFEWVAETFDGAPITDAYGQTEANGLVCYCAALMEYREGTVGRPTPGHEVAVVDSETVEPVDSGEVGEIAVRYEGDPVCFKEYWNAPDRTAAKVREGWLLTGDLGTVDADGYISFVGRKDETIISGGYRISPYEIEDTLAGHDAVSEVAVVGVPDEERGEVPKAFVVLAAGAERSVELRETLQTFVKERLAAYEYPRELAFVDGLPKTATGKIQRSVLAGRERS